MRVLIACEYSGRTRRSFEALGHSVTSVDLIESEDGSPSHIIGDAISLAYSGNFDLMIAHPPCTYLCNSGVRWLQGDTKRLEQMQQAANFFLKLMNAPIAKIAIENPIPHKYAKNLIGEYSQIIQPWMFGEHKTKATCLWLKGLPKLIETNNVKKQMDAMPKNQTHTTHYESPGPERQKNRSRTFESFAKQFAEQWGK